MYMASGRAYVYYLFTCHYAYYLRNRSPLIEWMAGLNLACHGLFWDRMPVKLRRRHAQARPVEGPQDRVAQCNLALPSASVNPNAATPLPWATQASLALSSLRAHIADNCLWALESTI